MGYCKNVYEVCFSNCHHQIVECQVVGTMGERENICKFIYYNLKFSLAIRCLKNIVIFFLAV